jgi:hypothetical protein
MQQEHVNQVEKLQTTRDTGVEQRFETNNSLGRESVSSQDLKRFKDALNQNGERSALQKLAAAFCEKSASQDSNKSSGLFAHDGQLGESPAHTNISLGPNKPYEPWEDVTNSGGITHRKKTPNELALEDERDLTAGGVAGTGTPLAEANAAQANPLSFPLPIRETRQLAQKIVDALLIHEAALNEKQEITICLKDCLLDGANVSIFRDGGTLRVAFSALTSDMATTVRLNQNALREALLEKTDIKEVKISASLREDGDTNHGRSRGYAGFLTDGEEEEETDSTGRRVRRHGRVARKSVAGHA